MIIFEIREHTQTRISTQKRGNMETKFLLNQEQSNLYKFIIIYKRFLKHELNADELFNFYNNLKLLKIDFENLELSKFILDEKFLDQFIFN